MADTIEIEDHGWHFGGDRDFTRDSLILSPQPPQAMAMHRLGWWSQRDICDMYCPIRRACAHKAKAVLKSLQSMPKWAVAATEAERRAAIHPKLLKEIDRWDGKRSLVILGPTGLGKTTGFVELTLQIVARDGVPKQWQVPAFYKAAELAQSWRTTKLGEDAIDAPCVTTAKTCQLLFIDDIGQEPNDPQAALMGIADARYDKGLISVVTSGLPYESFVKQYGDFFVRRFGDAAGKDSGLVIDLWK
jgi:DNA replication protein DnaC